jgi:pyruvate,orthophosphate dikinase
VGKLVDVGIKLGPQTRADLEVGICGEPSSVEFCYRVGMDYVSCSPYRVPIARLAAAQAAISGDKSETMRTAQLSQTAQRTERTLRPFALQWL